MERIQSIEQIRILQAEVRAKRSGFLTNFYLDEQKHAVWIKNNDFFVNPIGDTMFFVKQSKTFWNVFYTSTTPADLATDLKSFTDAVNEVSLIFDIVGRESQCKPLLDIFKANGFHVATSLVRMAKVTEETANVSDDGIVRADSTDIKCVFDLLHDFFNEKIEQIPYMEELEHYANDGHILICKEDGQMAGFLIYEINATTLYLRYWFTHPFFRDKKVGSRLLRRFFEEGNATKRQLFWVIQSNENAIKRYRHYGFQEENMFDYVMTTMSTAQRAGRGGTALNR